MKVVQTGARCHKQLRRHRISSAEGDKKSPLPPPPVPAHPGSNTGAFGANLLVRGTFLPPPAPPGGHHQGATTPPHPTPPHPPGCEVRRGPPPPGEQGEHPLAHQGCSPHTPKVRANPFFWGVGGCSGRSPVSGVSYPHPPVPTRTLSPGVGGVRPGGASLMTQRTPDLLLLQDVPFRPPATHPLPGGLRSLRTPSLLSRFGTIPP